VEVSFKATLRKLAGEVGCGMLQRVHLGARESTYSGACSMGFLERTRRAPR